MGLRHHPLKVFRLDGLHGPVNQLLNHSLDKLGVWVPGLPWQLLNVRLNALGLTLQLWLGNRLCIWLVFWFSSRFQVLLHLLFFLLFRWIWLCGRGLLSFDSCLPLCHLMDFLGVEGDVGHLIKRHLLI